MCQREQSQLSGEFVFFSPNVIPAFVSKLFLFIAHSGCQATSVDGQNRIEILD